MKDTLMLLYFPCLIFNLVSPKYVHINEIWSLEHALYNEKSKLLTVVEKLGFQFSPCKLNCISQVITASLLYGF